jgi:hypothetical protein
MQFDADDFYARTANDQLNVASRASIAFVAFWKMVLVWFGLLIVLGIFLTLAFEACEESYWEALWVECASATAIFMLSPMVLAQAEVNLKRNSILFVGGAIVLATIAFFLHGALELLLINLAVGLVLLLLLEVFFEKYVLGRIEQRLLEDLAELDSESAISGTAGLAQSPPPLRNAGVENPNSGNDSGAVD